jgi:bis(5'-nucleosyl)-tetraphosphatase (symmetrical)
MRQRVFVGDVQGCADELDGIVDRSRGELGGDFELLLTGDLVNRGPASLRVLARVRGLQDQGRARFVLGNHDVWLVSVALGVAPPGAADTFADVLDRSDLGDWIDWLRSQPLLIDGTLGSAPFALVHAALAPTWDLSDVRALAAELSSRVADPNRAAARAFLAAAHAERRRRASSLMGSSLAHPAPREALLLDALGRLLSERSERRAGGWSERPPEQLPDAEPWHAAWSRRGHDYGVVYGHWALQRLHVAPRLRGLDTGCVHHGRGGDGFLTAWLPDEAARDPFRVPDERFWRERARRRYWP